MKKMEVVLQEAQVAGEIVRQARGVEAEPSEVKRRKSADARAAKKKSIVAAPGAPPFTHAATHDGGMHAEDLDDLDTLPPSLPPSPPPSPPPAAAPKLRTGNAVVAPAPAGHHPGLPPPRKKRPRLQYSLAVLSAVAPCLLFVLLCQVLGVIENAMYECEATCPEAWDLLAGVAEASACWECCESDSGWAANCSLPAGADACAAHCWTFVDAFYYSITTLTTIGYGDVTPHSKPGKIIAAILIPFAIIALTSALGKIHDISQSRKMGADKTLRERIDELHEVIDADDDGIVSMEEYILFNLKKMGKVDDDTIALLREQFNALDADGSGALDAGDIDYLQQACDMMGDGSKPPSKLGSPRAASNAGKAEASDGRDGPDRYKP